MNIKNLCWIIFVGGLLASCNHTKTLEIKNKEKGQLKASMVLKSIGEKKFALDSGSAPKPQYMQMYMDSSGKRLFTFLNIYTNAIYFYDYETSAYLKNIPYSKTNIPMPVGYLIKNQDSIYVYNRKRNELILTNRSGQITAIISLINNMDPNNYDWIYSYPQHYPFTVTPILETKKGIIFPGQYMFAIPDTIVNKFKFATQIDPKTNEVTHQHLYPKELYGDNYNWEDEAIFTTVYYDIQPEDDKMIYSFPVSHDLYIAAPGSNSYQTVYGGSNIAGTISSIGKDLKKNTLSQEEFILKVCKTDLYAAIKYDKYRKVYYRFLRKAIPDANDKTDWKDKQVTIIIFDKNFKYLGETDIGTIKDYNWENSFVTEEGLNIEYIDRKKNNEDYLTLKIFQPKIIS